MLDELLGKAKEDGLVVQEVVTHFHLRLLRPEATDRSREERELLHIIN